MLHKNTASYFIASCLLALLLLGCNSSFSQRDQLNAEAFSKSIGEDTTAFVLDVRSADEYKQGHIARSVNINWNDPSFESQVKGLDKQTNVYLYCLSGGRSSRAAKALEDWGFKNVHELQGGLLKWKAASLPLDKVEGSQSPGLTLAEFENLITSDRIVLVDFYAEWCGPCKLMEPYLKEIDRDMKETVKLVRIDADKNEDLIHQLGIDALPVLRVYRHKKLSWAHLGYIKKEDVVKNLN